MRATCPAILIPLDLIFQIIQVIKLMKLLTMTFSPTP
jgi:hypothetical protein